MYRNLEAEIARCRMTREECAEAIGKSKGTFDRLMHGKQPFRLGQMVALQNELNDRMNSSLTLDYLFKEVPNAEGTTDSRAHGSSLRPD